MRQAVYSEKGPTFSTLSHKRACEIAAEQSRKTGLAYSVRQKTPQDPGATVFLAHPSGDTGFVEMGLCTDLFADGFRLPEPGPYLVPGLLDRAVRRNGEKTQLRDLVRMAKQAGGAGAALVVAEFCRFRLGLTYSETLELVRTEWPGLEGAEWDDLMEEAEEEENA